MELTEHLATIRAHLTALEYALGDPERFGPFIERRAGIAVDGARREIAALERTIQLDEMRVR